MGTGRPRGRGGLVVALTLALTIAIGAGGAGTAREGTPAATPDPRFRLPDLAVLPTEQVVLATDPADGRRRLRFSTTIANVGAGPMDLLGEPDPATGTVVVRQRLEGEGGAAVLAVGTFVFDAAHGHWHVDDLVLTELWAAGPDGAPERLVAATGKTSFCLVDAWRLEPAPVGAARFPTFLVCVPTRQGLSPGWSDRYDATLPGQELDATGLPDGRYVLRTIVDPDGLLHEAQTANNTLDVAVELRGSEARH